MLAVDLHVIARHAQEAEEGGQGDPVAGDGADGGVAESRGRHVHVADVVHDLVDHPQVLRKKLEPSHRMSSTRPQQLDKVSEGDGAVPLLRVGGEGDVDGGAIGVAVNHHVSFYPEPRRGDVVVGDAL